MYIYKHMLISHHKNAAQTLLKTVFPGSCDIETNYLYPGSSKLELSSSVLTDILFRIIEEPRMERTLEVIWTNTLPRAGPHNYHLHKHNHCTIYTNIFKHRLHTHFFPLPFF